MPVKFMREIWDSDKEHINCFVNPGLLPTGGIMLICGEPGIGKSFLGQQIAFELSCGRRLLGLFPTRQVTTIFLELEKRSPIARARFRREDWQKEYPDAALTLGYYDDDIPQLDTPAGLIKLEELLVKNVKVIVVDSFTTTVLDESDTIHIKKAVANYRGLAKKHNISFVLIQHLVKRPTAYDPKQGKWKEPPLRLNDIRGSKYLQYEVDTAIGVAVSKSQEREVGFLKHSFCPYQLSEQPPLTFKYKPDTTHPFSFSLHKSKEMLDYLECGSASYSDLESFLQLSRPTLRGIVDTLEGIGIVRKNFSKGKNEGWVELIDSIIT